LDTEKLNERRAESRLWSMPWGGVATFAFLYLISVGLGIYRLRSQPASEYNWEAYALRGLFSFIQHPSRAVLNLNEGLMTSSGDSIVVVGPAWLTSTLFGTSFVSLRLATLLIAALAVPLTWVLGRTLWSDAVGLCAALIVATSQVFLLYSRTGTNVGLSIAPAVLGYLLLWKTVRPGSRRWWLWTLLLQVSLIVNSWFYSPIRFLWPIAIALLAADFAVRSGSRRRFAVSLLITCVTLPVALVALTDAPANSPVAAVKAYYNGRGEQIFRIDDSSDALVSNLPIHSDAERKDLEQESKNTLVGKFIRKNAIDLMNLLLDRHTRPAITDYANAHGRLYSRELVPLALASLLLSLWTMFKLPKSRWMLALSAGYTLPLLLTSNVHIGRLVFALPLLALLAAMPIEPLVRLTARLPMVRAWTWFPRWAPVALAIAIVALAAVPSLRDWTETPFPRQRGVFVAEQMSTAMRQNPAQRLAYVFGEANAWDSESLRIAVLRIELRGAVHFVDVTTGETLDSGPIPVLDHGLLTALANPSSVPGYCTNLYVVETNLAAQFADVTEARARAICGTPLKSLILAG